MDNRIVFREMLTELKEIADAENGFLTKTRIRDALKGMPLEESHFQLIYDYLAEQNIHVVESEEQMASALQEGSASENGTNSDSDNLESTEERQSLSLYVDELSALADVNDAEEIQLIDRVRAGDTVSKAKLIELYLPLICTMAEDYGEEVLPSEDLIQEGNLGLLAAVDSLAEFESAAACRVHILNTIREAMEKAVSHGQERSRMDDALVSRMNHLNEAVHNLERDLGRKVSAEEVSAYLEMPMEEIEDLLRVAGEQIETDS